MFELLLCNVQVADECNVLLDLPLFVTPLSSFTLHFRMPVRIAEIALKERALSISIVRALETLAPPNRAIVRCNAVERRSNSLAENSRPGRVRYRWLPG